MTLSRSYVHWPPRRQEAYRPLHNTQALTWLLCLHRSILLSQGHLACVRLKSPAVWNESQCLSTSVRQCASTFMSILTLTSDISHFGTGSDGENLWSAGLSSLPSHLCLPPSKGLSLAHVFEPVRTCRQFLVNHSAVICQRGHLLGPLPPHCRCFLSNRSITWASRDPGRIWAWLWSWSRFGCLTRS